MVVRLLTHPLAEDIFVFLSLGSILLSAGLVGSLWWSVPSDEDGFSHRTPASVTTASAASPLVPSGSLSIACARYSGFVEEAALAGCRR
jgi:hypothetical protein